MRRLLCPVLLIALAIPSAAQTVPPAAGGADRPLDALPYSPSLDLTAMDRSADPCVDFYAFSCGGWKRLNPIPPDRASWDVYSKLQNDNQQFLWGLLERASDPAATRSPVERQIGDYFAACMDVAAVEQAGTAPLAADLKAIDGLMTPRELPVLLARFHLAGSAGEMLFGLEASQDFEDTSRVIAFATASGLGLPDRDYYVKDDSRSVEIRKRYLAHVAEMLALSGVPAQRTGADALSVMRFETALARASLTQVELRDPHRLNNPMSRRDLQALTPSFEWDRYLDAMGIAHITRINVTEPAFFKALAKELAAISVDDLRTYLRWHLVAVRAPFLTDAFANERFAFASGYLRGIERIAPRWKRCVQWVDRDLGEALGQVFVARVFPPERRTETLDMVKRVERAMDARIRELPWMTPATKREALTKLQAMQNKIGYPDRWRDYSAVQISRTDFAGNVVRAVEFESRRQLAKIGKPVDRTEWQMTPATVNAYYDPQMNDMNFTAGILMPPLYDPKSDAAPNYGNTGATIGHELTHGFDDEGSQFDAKGNLRDWWSPADRAEFDGRTQCIVDQYAQYTVVGDVKINSRLTLGEDVADLGGLILAYIAWKDAVRDSSFEPLDGLTPPQRFFVGFAQWACSNEREEDKRLRAITDAHSPPEYRINGVVVNVPEFRDAFSCKVGQPLVREPVCRVW